MDKRRSPRLAVQLPISFCGDQFAGEGIVFNISLDGCTVGCEEDIRPGTHLELHLHLPDHESPIKVEQAAVQWSLVQKFGCKFVRIENDHQDRLDQFVKRHPDGFSSRV